jgi:hypothetical protein
MRIIAGANGAVRASRMIDEGQLQLPDATARRP